MFLGYLPPSHQLVDSVLSTSWFFIIHGIMLKSLKAPWPTDQRALGDLHNLSHSFNEFLKIEFIRCSMMNSIKIGTRTSSSQKGGKIMTT